MPDLEIILPETFQELTATQTTESQQQLTSGRKIETLNYLGKQIENLAEMTAAPTTTYLNRQQDSNNFNHEFSKWTNDCNDKISVGENKHTIPRAS